ncbi:hypothetical protein [Massilia pseudoviolaceinigra]|uniref:hypothetical protein n=1 Tax=Massilia pseudoviolaceinigra TaxID=3057165 RepID=UPI002796A996|nr:hypothetical protein [Massilia sp. CCM 9206]MDQ1921660.1 hypothetical protein [Massilia sp. CCM 9206]
MKRLYKVRMITYSVVVADDADQADRIATEYGSELTEDVTPSDTCVVGEVTDAGDLPRGWDVQDTPYGDNSDEWTVGAILDALPVADTKTIDMFAEVAPC